MRRMRRGFTLTEMLAVIGIGMVLMAGTIGALYALAGHIGPDNGAATLQAMLNATKAYAASHGVEARLVVESSMDNLENGSRLYVQYKEPDDAGWGNPVVAPVNEVNLGKNMVVLRDLPSGMPSLPSAAPPKDRAPTAAEIDQWRDYRNDLMQALARHGFSDVSNGIIGQGGDVRADQDEFYVYFEPEGYLKRDPPADGAEQVLLIVQIGGRRVKEYAFYPLNPNTGSRMLFE